MDSPTKEEEKEEAYRRLWSHFFTKEDREIVVKHMEELGMYKHVEKEFNVTNPSDRT